MITQTSCTIFGVNLLSGLENFTATSPYVYKIALYNANANLNNSTTTYTSVNEVTGSGYTAGGKVLTPISLGSDNTNNTAFVSFNNATWTPASFTTRGALIYNSSTNAAVFVLNFGSDKTPNGTFTVTFPTANSTNAIIRIT
jgi:hypothetical protein